MNEFSSPVPLPAVDAADPGVYREIYGMPAFVTVPTADLEASKRFWIDGLGFIDLFSVPAQVTHLRRWAFQDVLLVPGEPAPSATSINFAAVPGQLDELVKRCEQLLPGCTDGPHEKPWNSLELTVTTPEQTRVVMTAARPIDRNGPHAEWLREVGIPLPE
jgi:catechol 2,3-dioxygenase-like lactoylglutathione lyase family enzyme